MCLTQNVDPHMRYMKLFSFNDVMIQQMKDIYEQGKDKRGRPLQREFEFYIHEIFLVLKSGMAWKYLRSTLHYTAIFKMFQKLIDRDVFILAYKKAVDIYYTNHKSDFKILYMDSTMIKNINGSELIGRNHYDRYRFGTKINIISNVNGIPIGILVVPANKNDSTLTKDTINNICIDIKSYYLGTDKGYINKSVKKTLKDSHGIFLIYPCRKNQKKINTEYQQSILQDRYKIENFMAWIKQYKRIANRYDKTIKSFIGFLYFALTDIIFKKMS